jgi:hypothetical protein
MADHEKTAEALEREADDMARRGEQVGDDIKATREEWEAKQRDSAVPGATGEPREEMPPPEPDETD